MVWTPNRVTLLRVVLGAVAVGLFGRTMWMNVLAVGATVACIALDALDGHIARRKNLVTAAGAQLDILGDRIVENMYFTYFAVIGMVSLWLPILFFVRGAATDFFRGLAFKAGHSGWGTNAMLHTWWGRALVGSRWSRGTYAALKCVCFCFLGLELVLTGGQEPRFGLDRLDIRAAIRGGEQILIWATALFCVVRGVPVAIEGWKFLASNLSNHKPPNAAPGDAG